MLEILNKKVDPDVGKGQTEADNEYGYWNCNFLRYETDTIKIENERHLIICCRAYIWLPKYVIKTCYIAS